MCVSKRTCPAIGGNLARFFGAHIWNLCLGLAALKWERKVDFKQVKYFRREIYHWSLCPLPSCYTRLCLPCLSSLGTFEVRWSGVESAERCCLLILLQLAYSEDGWMSILHRQHYVLCLLLSPRTLIWLWRPVVKKFTPSLLFLHSPAESHIPLSTAQRMPAFTYAKRRHCENGALMLCESEDS